MIRLCRCVRRHTPSHRPSMKAGAQAGLLIWPDLDVEVNGWDVGGWRDRRDRIHDFLDAGCHGSGQASQVGRVPAASEAMRKREARARRPGAGCGCRPASRPSRFAACYAFRAHPLPLGEQIWAPAKLGHHLVPRARLPLVATRRSAFRLQRRLPAFSAHQDGGQRWIWAATRVTDPRGAARQRRSRLRSAALGRGGRQALRGRGGACNTPRASGTGAG